MPRKIPTFRTVLMATAIYIIGAPAQFPGKTTVSAVPVNSESSSNTSDVHNPPSKDVLKNDCLNMETDNVTSSESSDWSIDKVPCTTASDNCGISENDFPYGIAMIAGMIPWVIDTLCPPSNKKSKMKHPLSWIMLFYFWSLIFFHFIFMFRDWNFFTVVDKVVLARDLFTLGNFQRLSQILFVSEIIYWPSEEPGAEWGVQKVNGSIRVVNKISVLAYVAIMFSMVVMYVALFLYIAWNFNALVWVLDVAWLWTYYVIIFDVEMFLFIRIDEYHYPCDRAIHLHEVPFLLEPEHPPRY